jgi:aminopeptidase 2
MRGLVFATAARLGDAKTFDKLLAIHNASTSAEERVTLASALTNFKQPELVKRALAMIDTDEVRLQDAMYWVAYSFTNRHARKATWEWMTSHWDWLKENLGTDLAFSRLPLYAARVSSDAAFLETYTKFFEPILEPTIERTYRQGHEMIEWQAAWRTRDLNAIKAYFATQQA